VTGRRSSTSTRKGALCYLAAWDNRRARIFDRCEPKDGIQPFAALVEQFMSVEPYASAQRVFLIVDNGSAHRGQRSIDRLQGAWPNLILVHTPVHASWLNQAEIYLSVLQRKALQPNDFADLDALEQHLLAFRRRYEQIARRLNGGSPAATSRSSWHSSTMPSPGRSPSRPRDPPIRQATPNVKELPSQRRTRLRTPSVSPDTYEWDH
jgi:hypothetical protein